MAEYIDREALEAKLNERYGFLLVENGPFDHYTDGYGEAVDTVEEFPTADVAPVVRCRDCRKMKTSECPIQSCGYDDFCNYGERRDGE